MAWMVFGTFFLLDAHAAWYWYVAWIAGNIYDLKKEHDQKVLEAIRSVGRVL
jgi:hypothetical protein